MVWYINLCGLFNTKAILAEEKWYYLTHSCVDKGLCTFPKSISLKVNAMMQLKHKLANDNVTVQYISHDTTGTPHGEV